MCRKRFRHVLARESASCGWREAGRKRKWQTALGLTAPISAMLNAARKTSACPQWTFWRRVLKSALPGCSPAFDRDRRESLSIELFQAPAAPCQLSSDSRTLIFRLEVSSVQSSVTSLDSDGSKPKCLRHFLYSSSVRRRLSCWDSSKGAKKLLISSSAEIN